MSGRLAPLARQVPAPTVPILRRATSRTGNYCRLQRRLLQGGLGNPL